MSSCSPTPAPKALAPSNPRATATATFAGGCFWCMEAVFQEVEGVDSVVSGYTGGAMPDPDYKTVCTGTTGHAEAVQIHYDPAQVGYETLLEFFWVVHDPTTPNRQGEDIGTQYRSAIFTHDDAQAAAARRSLELAQARFDRPIATTIQPLGTFWTAEDYHQDFFARNPDQPYCVHTIPPKLEKLRKKVKALGKDD